MPSKTPNNKKENQEVLLKEYEMARNSFNQIEGIIWQSAAIFIVLSLGGVSILFSINKHDWGSFVAVASIGFTSVSILWLWYSAAKRWWGLEGVFLFRMQEIETKLGMWAQRYVNYLDTTRIYKRDYPFAEQQEEEIFSRLDKRIRYYGKVPARNWMRMIIIVLVIGWIILTIREYLLAFSYP